MRSVAPLYHTPLESKRRYVNGLEITEPTPDALRIILDKSKEIQSELRSIPVKERLVALSQLGQRWGEKVADGRLTELRAELSQSTGYSEQLIDLEFRLVQSVLSFDELYGNLESTLIGGVKSLEGFVEHAKGEAITNSPSGPVFIISSGNSLIPPLIPTAIALATGNLVMLKPSLANNGGIVDVFRELYAIDSPAARALTNALLVAYFSHDSEALDYLLAKAPLGVVNFWGAEPARTSVANKININPSHPKFIVNGPLTGIAIIDASSATQEAAQGLAMNTVLYDQQLCSSPTQVAFIGTRDETESFMKATGSMLDTIGSRIPMNAGEGYMYLLQSARKALILKGGRVISSNDASNPWTILINKGSEPLQQVMTAFPEFGIHTRRRFLEVTPVNSLGEALELITSLAKNPAYRGAEKVQTVGTMLCEGNLSGVLERLALSGVYRIVPVQDMYMRSRGEPYDGTSLADAFTYRVYHRSKPLPGAVTI